MALWHDCIDQRIEHIPLQFLGYVGMGFGILILNNIGESLEGYFIKNPYIDVETALFSTLILILFGGIAGYIPAKRAASIKPIVALRDE